MIAVGVVRALGRNGVQGVVLLVLVLMLAVVVRLPWVGDLGIHAATTERLRHSLFDPGNPLVAEDTPSPYYSPWMLLLGCLAKATGLSVFVVLRIAALISLALLVTGVRHFVRTFSTRRAAVPLALLCVLFLWGTELFAWSGFLGLNSLALTVSYPSTFALALAFHFWALLRKALPGPAGWWTFAGLGLMWAVILLSHQFSGVVASLGALALVLGARPWPGRDAWARLGVGLALGVVALAVWPYYDFFALFGTQDLDAIHRSLFRDVLPRFWLVLVGVAALAVRWRRDRRDPLVIFFLMGALVFMAGWLTGHYSWGRVLPAALIPAQLAAALEAAEWSGRRAGSPATRPATLFAAVLAAALLVGAWTQAGTLGYAIRPGLLPTAVADKYRKPWNGYHWITPWVSYGDVVMAKTFPARQIPAYGPYTVAPGYPDFFLPDQQQRLDAVERYFAAGTPRAERLGILHRYGVRWIVQRPRDGGLPAGDPGLRRVTSGPGGQILYEVVG
ncbi:hypothetical protein H1V43_02560 [Streptomyces sp. PSKA54]|uniref:Integral membrane protein n=1 Tax=Streptomyces himalayensis subsp. aureolus TaxID=2758039 RepID=A0A7W2HDY6_9ACTN|nr:hypothetical protein [Streptomyces himalayensis]MBA4860282.1 hypothetical protein [Streptomyces himalayensis subsp. aureolus]